MTSYSYNQKNTISYLEESKVYPVSERDWNRLASTARDCKIKNNFWGIASSAFFGVTASGFIQWLVIRKDDAYKELSTIILVVFLASLLIAILCLLAGRTHRVSQEDSINDIVDEINFIEGGFPKESNKDAKDD